MLGTGSGEGLPSLFSAQDSFPSHHLKTPAGWRRQGSALLVRGTRTVVLERVEETVLSESPLRARPGLMFHFLYQLWEIGRKGQEEGPGVESKVSDLSPFSAPALGPEGWALGCEPQSSPDRLRRAVLWASNSRGGNGRVHRALLLSSRFHGWWWWGGGKLSGLNAILGTFFLNDTQFYFLRL